MVLAWVNNIHAPCTDTVIQLVRTCVNRHLTLPSVIVVDWGADLRSTWLQKTLTALGVTLIYRPKASGRSGAPVESLFAATDRRYIHTLNL